MSDLLGWGLGHIPHGVGIGLGLAAARYAWKAASWVKDTKQDIVTWAEVLVGNHLKSIQDATKAAADAQARQCELLAGIGSGIEKLGVELEHERELTATHRQDEQRWQDRVEGKIDQLPRGDR